jgi:hypothetical protein
LFFLQEDIFVKKPFEAPPSDVPAPPSGQDLENEWLFAQLQQIKGLSDSVPQWPEDQPPEAPLEAPKPTPYQASMAMVTPANTHNLLSAYGFFSR